ncbi:hypothetical protein [Microcoleus sp. MON2_D5]|uniref:hypothetical protein n=1 Tax=Microcoleus sp. MON2_D5 TaxID=2818833 RepID=UPI002FD2F517
MNISIATNTPIVGETEPNPTPTHAPNLEEYGRYTLYTRNPNPHCICKLTNYFSSCPNIKVVLRDLYEMEPKVRA